MPRQKKEKLGLYRYSEDFGRMGSLTELFVALPSQVERCMGRQIYWGEVLGKHSEISGEFSQDTITLITNDKKVVAVLLENHLLGSDVVGKLYEDQFSTSNDDDLTCILCGKEMDRVETSYEDEGEQVKYFDIQHECVLAKVKSAFTCVVMAQSESSPRRTMKLLSNSFLADYKNISGLNSLLAKAVWGSKLYREEDVDWLGCVRRVVEGNCALDKNVTQEEAEKLFHNIFFTRILPSGRGLWTCGVPGMPSDASQNCWAIEINSIEDLEAGMNLLMCGGGVGFSTLRTSEMSKVAGRSVGNPRVTIVCNPNHKDYEKLNADTQICNNFVMVPDTREGWGQALTHCLKAAYLGVPVSFDVSLIRAEGEPLKTFGGKASGSKALADLLRGAYYLVRSAAGRKLTQGEWKDLCCMVGKCVVAGSARRSAILTLGDLDNASFWYDKNDTDKLTSLRFASNNSIAIREPRDYQRIDYLALAESMLYRGDAGIINLWNIWKTDSGVVCLNPCGEATLHNYESCCLGEWFPSKMSSEGDRTDALQLITRFTLRQRLLPMSHPKAEEIRQKNMRIGVGVSGITEVSPYFPWDKYRSCVDGTAESYAFELGVNVPVTTTVVKPSGTVSLLSGTTPGIHADFAPYYIRRVRAPKNSNISYSLQAAGVPFEPCVYDSSNNTLAFEFPVKSNAKVFESDESLEVQFKRLRDVQEGWSNQSVSCTLKAHPSEAAHLGRLLEEHVPHLKAISCLARDATAYAQPPYESITAEEFGKRDAQIDTNYPLVYGGKLQYDECEGGACPIN